MKSKYFLAGAAAAFIALSAFIYSDPLGDKIAKALDTFSSKFPQEKVYLQFDKDYYASGEVIWFKAYIMSQGSPVFLNQNLYVELMDQKGKILQRNKLPVKEGGSEGDFELPDNFAAGNYRIRAYTQWMRNVGDDFFFDRTFTVGAAYAGAVSRRRGGSAAVRASDRGQGDGAAAQAVAGTGPGDRPCRSLRDAADPPAGCATRSRSCAGTSTRWSPSATSW